MERFQKLVILDNIAMFAEERARLQSLATEVVWVTRDLPKNIPNPPTGDQYCILPIRDAAQLLPTLEGADAIITCWTPVGPEVLAGSPKLRYVGLWTNLWQHRVEPADVIARNIHVDYLPDYGTSVVPEYVFAGLLSMARRPHFHHQETRRGSWPYELLKTGRRRILSPEDVDEWSLQGKNLGILGLGRIGSRVAEIALAFGMNVAYHSRSRKEGLEARGVSYLDLSNLCQWSDVITIHLPPDVTGLIGRHELGLMRDGTVVVNTASGCAIDQAALIEELRASRLSAFLDVYEGLPPRRELKDLPNVLFSYRAAWFTRTSVKLKGKLLLDRMEAFLRGEPHAGCATLELSISSASKNAP